MIFQKLAQWYRHKYKRPQAPKDSPTAGPFATVLAEHTTKPPRKLNPFHHYLKLYYISRIKDKYNRRYSLAKKQYDEATEVERTEQKLKKPVPVQIRTEIGREFWMLESSEFRDQIAKSADDAHERDMEEWEENQQTPKTPQQFHQ
jgi:HSP90 family molecular chaperone